MSMNVVHIDTGFELIDELVNSGSQSSKTNRYICFIIWY